MCTKKWKEDLLVERRRPQHAHIYNWSEHEYERNSWTTDEAELPARRARPQHSLGARFRPENAIFRRLGGSNCNARGQLHAFSAFCRPNGRNPGRKRGRRGFPEHESPLYLIDKSGLVHKRVSLGVVWLAAHSIPIDSLWKLSLST